MLLRMFSNLEPTRVYLALLEIRDECGTGEFPANHAGAISPSTVLTSNDKVDYTLNEKS